MDSYSVGVLLLLAAVAGITLFEPDDDTSCSWDQGGYVHTCASMVNELPAGHRVPAGVYASAGVMILHNAGCVERGSVFRFHSAFNRERHILVPSPRGNDVQQQYLAQWPRLLKHLDVVGAFRKFTLTDMSANELARYGVPICE